MIRIGDGDDSMDLRLSSELVALDSPTELTGVGALEPLHRLGASQLLRASEAASSFIAKARAAGATCREVLHSSDDGVAFVPTGDIFVELAGDHPAIARLLGRLGYTIAETRGAHGRILRAGASAAPVLDAVAALSAQPGIVRVEPDLWTHARLKATPRAPSPRARKGRFALPSDERLEDQWHLENRGEHFGTNTCFVAGADARVVAAWREAQTLGRRDVVVALIDDGFDLEHPDLSGRGKIVAPRDFGRDGYDPLPDPLAHNWHGTAAAGVAVARADGGGVVGVAPACRLMPIRFGAISDAAVEAWFEWALDHGASVISCSWGAQARIARLSSRKKRAIARCVEEGRDGLGTVVCFAAGNDGEDVNSAGYVDGYVIHPDVIAVSACDSLDRRVDYANFGDAIWIAAPSSGPNGWGVLTSDVTGTYKQGDQVAEQGLGPGDYTDAFGQTSAACPIVAGVAALVLSVNPKLTAREVKALLGETARKVDPNNAAYDARGHSRVFGWGCVDAAAAVRRARELAR